MSDGIIDWPKWVRSWPCIDENCDGKGTACAGAHDHGDGDFEYELYQCQFCDEREQLAKQIEHQRTAISSALSILKTDLHVSRAENARAVLEAALEELDNDT